MEYSTIEKNYFIVSTAFRFGKEILVCRKKNDLSFAYYYVDGDEYVLADENLAKELNKIYVIKPSDIRYSIRENSDVSSYTKQQLQQMVKDVKSKLGNFLQSKLPDKENIIAQERLRKVNVGFYSKETKMVGRNGSYNPFFNKIFVLLDKEPEETLCHELLHAIGRKLRQSGLEYNFDKNLFATYAKILISFLGYAGNALGIGLEEAVTEYFAESLTYETGSYADLPNTFGKLCRYLDVGKVLQFKVNNDLKSFVEYVKNEFHETSNERVLDLIVKMDGYYAIYSKEKEKPNDLDTCELNNLSLSMTKLLVDLIFNKYTKEGRDISSLQYSDIFGDAKLCLYSNDENSNIFEMFESQINEYIQYKKNQLNEKTDSNIDIKKLANFYLFKTSKSVVRVITNNGFLIPEEYKSAASLMAVINSLVDNASWLCFNIKINTAKSSVVRDFLNPLKGFLPKDLHERQKFYKSVLQISSTLNFNIFKKIPMKNIINILNQEPSLIESAIRNAPNYAMTKILPNLDTGVIEKYKKIGYYTAMKEVYEKD